MVSMEIIVVSCAVCTLGGSAAGWFGKNFTIKRNGNGHLTKEDHVILCAPVKKELEEGNKKFEEIRDTMNMILNTLLNQRKN
jgi:hypothetical protein